MLAVSSDPVENEKAEELLSGFRQIAPAFFKRLEDEVKRIEGELNGFDKKAKKALPSTTPAVSKKPQTPVKWSSVITNESCFPVCSGNLAPPSASVKEQQELQNLME
jgi:hypothetical protein